MDYDVESEESGFLQNTVFDSSQHKSAGVPSAEVDSDDEYEVPNHLSPSEQISLDDEGPFSESARWNAPNITYKSIRSLYGAFQIFARRSRDVDVNIPAGKVVKGKLCLAPGYQRGECISYLPSLRFFFTCYMLSYAQVVCGSQEERSCCSIPSPRGSQYPR